MLLVSKNPWMADEAMGLPSGAEPVGYALLVRQYDLSVMPNFRWSFVAKAARQSVVEQGLVWETFPLAYAPQDLPGHIEFALRYDGVNLEIFAALFRTLGEPEIALLTAWIQGTPTGVYTRKTWFLYESLTGNRLAIPDLTQGNYEPLLDPSTYFTGDVRRSRRHRIADNLLGSVAFSPVVRRTPVIEHFVSRRLDRRLVELLRGYDPETLLRAAQWLYTKETRSSFAIEHEKPAQDKMTRFVAVLRQAKDLRAVTPEALVYLQGLLVDPRFRETGWREGQNYVAADARVHVDFVSPKPEDLAGLMDGLLDCVGRLERSDIDAVVAAAVAAFGFVFLHPFEDGNGRIHRFLIHYLLVRKGFTPPDTIVPVSATMLARTAEYDACLERFSVPLMARVTYELDSQGHVEVLTDTAGFYRHFDATSMVEALYGWLAHAIDHDFVAELEFMVVYGEVRRRLAEVVSLPERLENQLVARCLENGGKLSHKRRKSMFPMLTDEEVAGVEGLIEEVRAGNGRGKVPE